MGAPSLLRPTMVEGGGGWEGGAGVAGGSSFLTEPESLKPLRVLAQKMVAAWFLPEVAIWKSVSATLKFASIAASESSLRKCLRKVRGAMPIMMAIWYCGVPRAHMR